MAERSCRECGFVTHSQVAADCPNCGERLPRFVAGAGLGQAVRALAFLVGITVIAMFAREGLQFAKDLLQPAATPAAVATPEPSPITAGDVAPAAATSQDEWTPKDVATARKALADKDAARRVVAVTYLGEHGNVRDVAALLDRFKDTDGNVRWKATEAVGRLLKTPAARAAAPAQTRAATALLIAGLRDSELAASFAAAIALADMEAREATDALLEALSYRSGGAIGAAAALGTLREPRAVAPLIELLQDESTRWHAAQALGEIGGPAAERALMDALERKDYAIMAGAHAFYLRRGGPGMEEALVDLLQQSNDLAVAQTFIVEGSPSLSKAARAWAEGRGFKLEKTSDGHTWVQTQAPQ